MSQRSEMRESSPCRSEIRESSPRSELRQSSPSGGGNDSGCGCGCVVVIIVIAIIWFVWTNNKKDAPAKKEKARIEQEAARKKNEDKSRKLEETVKNREMEKQKAIEETGQKAEIEKQKAAEETVKTEMKHQELWDVAAKSANQAIADKSNFESAIACLENIKANCKGTKFESMADNEIARLVIVRDGLEEEKKRKADEEKRLVVEAAKAQSEKEAAVLEEKKKSALLESLADDIMKEDYKAALVKFTKKNMLLPELKEILETLSKSNEIILSSFKNEIGKIIFIGLENRTEKSRIIKVEGECIYCEQPVGKSLIVTKYALKDLNSDEKIKRLSTVNPTVAAIYNGVSEAKAGKFDAAASSFDNCGILSQVLKNELDEMKTRKRLGQKIPAIDK